MLTAFIAAALAACGSPPESATEGQADAAPIADAAATADAAAPADDSPPAPSFGSVGACVTDSDCASACAKSGSPFYNCVSATQAGFGFSNACVWPTVSNTVVTYGGAPGNSTRMGLVYVACQ